MDSSDNEVAEVRRVLSTGPPNHRQKPIRRPSKPDTARPSLADSPMMTTEAGFHTGAGYYSGGMCTFASGSHR